MEHQVNDLVKIMKALSDPTRIKMVKMLQHKTLCVCEMQAALGHSQPNVSKHLKILQEAGLVESWKDGLWVNYTLIPDGKASPYTATLLHNLAGWLEDDSDMKAILQKVELVDRAALCQG